MKRASCLAARLVACRSRTRGDSHLGKNVFRGAAVPGIDDTLPRTARIFPPDGHALSELCAHLARGVSKRDAIVLDEISHVSALRDDGALRTPGDAEPGILLSLIHISE